MAFTIQPQSQREALFVPQLFQPQRARTRRRGGESSLQQAPAADVSRGDRRTQPDHLLRPNIDSAALELGDHGRRRCLVDAEQVHRQLHPPAGELEDQRLNATHAGTRFAQGSRERSRLDNRHPGQQHVERDQGQPGPNRHRTSGGVEVRASQVQAGAAGPDVGQRPVLAIPVDGDAQLAPDALADLSRDLTRRIQRAPAEWHDRDHVGRPDTRMDARVRAHVDALHGRADRGQQPVDEPVPLRGERDDGAVMVGIRVDIEDVRAPGPARSRR